jgi:hypothetical protein
VIARSPMRTRKAAPTAIDGELIIADFIKGEVESSTCCREAAARGGGEDTAKSRPLPLPRALLTNLPPLPCLTATSDASASSPCLGESRSSGGGDGGAKLNIFGANTAPFSVES